jgi:hypothetical protein
MIAIITMLVLAAIIGGAAIVIHEVRTLRPGETVSFETHRVTVREISYNPAYGYLVWAQVCVLKPVGNAPTNRLTWRAWTVVDENGKRYAPSLVDDSVRPPDMYPRDGRYAVDQCASGVLPFAGLTKGSKIAKIIYRGSTNEAIWRP